MPKGSEKAPSPCADLWICQGRMCTAHGAEAIKIVANSALEEAIEAGLLEPDATRLLRGGCYGLCEMAPNAVIRTWPSVQQRPGPEADRLVLLGRSNETVYCTLEPSDMKELVARHMAEGEEVVRLSRQAREDARPARGRTAERIRALRERAGGRPHRSLDNEQA
jgi:(2Fe-2S) ferredoxin